MKNHTLRTVIRIVKLSVLIIFISLFVGINNTENIKVENNNLNKNLDLIAMAKLVEENEYDKLYTPIDSFFGDLTGYTADCPLCSGKLACLPSYDVLNGTVTYNDAVYGDVNIVASSANLPCGSIVKINSDRVESGEIVAIVLDRGVGGRSLDLLTNTTENAYSIGRSTVSYDVLRQGW